MIIQLEPGDLAEATSGPLEGAQVTITSDLNEDGYHLAHTEDEEEWAVHRSVLAPLLEMSAEEESDRQVPPFGLSSKQLADYTQRFLQDCMSRIEGVGNEQYGRETYQKFETMSPLELVDSIEEEVLDIPNYCAMLYIILQRMRNSIGEAVIG